MGKPGPDDVAEETQKDIPDKDIIGKSQPDDEIKPEDMIVNKVKEEKEENGLEDIKEKEIIKESLVEENLILSNSVHEEKKR